MRTMLQWNDGKRDFNNSMEPLSHLRLGRTLHEADADLAVPLSDVTT